MTTANPFEDRQLQHSWILGSLSRSGQSARKSMKDLLWRVRPSELGADVHAALEAYFEAADRLGEVAATELAAIGGHT